MAAISPSSSPPFHPSTAAAPTVEQAAREVMEGLRSSLEELLRGLGHPVRRAVDVQNTLKLDKKLAWQVFRLVRSEGLGEIENVPSASSVRRLLAAAKRRRVPSPLLERVGQAFEAFEDLAMVHGGDRVGLISIVSGDVHGGLDQYEQKVRKSLFHGNAHVYGVKAHTLVRTFVYHGREGPRHYDDLVMVQADIGLQRLRTGQPLSIACCLKTSNSPPSEGDSTPTGTWRSPSGAETSRPPGPELLAEFCSQPLPVATPRPSGLGGIETELVFPTSGRTGAVTLYSTIGMEDTREGESGTYFGKTLIAIPTESIVIDMLLPTGWTNPASARLGVYARRGLPEHVYEMRTSDLLPQREAFAFLGTMDGPPSIVGAPDYQAAVRHVLAQRGWLGTRFDIYRCRLAYPVLHSMLFYGVDVRR